MLLYIVRHAFAGQHGDPRYPDDDLRPLTKKGRNRFSRLVKKLARRGFEPTLVATSPLVRCRQTAQVIVDRLGSSAQLMELSELAPGSELAGLVAWTNAQKQETVAWVGHAPDVDRLTAMLIGSGSSQVSLTKGAIAAIEFPDHIASGDGELRWLVTPTVMGC
jgi:phosphohistidine phosphatase